MDDDIPIEGGLAGQTAQQQASISLAKNSRSYQNIDGRSSEVWNPTINEYGEEQEAMSSPEETKVNQQRKLDSEGSEQEEDSKKSGEEYAVDRAVKLGFFIDDNEFCLTSKDVKIM